MKFRNNKDDDVEMDQMKCSTAADIGIIKWILFMKHELFSITKMR